MKWQEELEREEAELRHSDHKCSVCGTVRTIRGDVRSFAGVDCLACTKYGAASDVERALLDVIAKVAAEGDPFGFEHVRPRRQIFGGTTKAGSFRVVLENAVRDYPPDVAAPVDGWRALIAALAFDLGLPWAWEPAPLAKPVDYYDTDPRGEPDLPGVKIGPDGKARPLQHFKCSDPFCPGLPFKASEQRHPYPCGANETRPRPAPSPDSKIPNLADFLTEGGE